MMPSDQRGGLLPRGGGVLEVEEYVEFLAKEYLSGYVARGGAAVKLVVVGGRRRLTRGCRPGWPRRPPTASCSPRSTPPAPGCTWSTSYSPRSPGRWTGSGSPRRRGTRGRTERVGFPAQGGTPSGPSVVGGGAPTTRSTRPSSTAASAGPSSTPCCGDPTLAHEFRVAMLRLCQARLGRGDVDVAEREAVLGWLRGERVPAAQLRAVSLLTPGRPAQRPPAAAVAGPLAAPGRPARADRAAARPGPAGGRPPAAGRCPRTASTTRRPRPSTRTRCCASSSTPPTSWQESFVAVLIPPELVTDETRGLPAYSALQLQGRR